MSKLGSTFRNQNPGVVFSNNGASLFVDIRPASAEIVVIDSDADGLVDTVEFIPSHENVSVYYSLNYASGPYVLWDGEPIEIVQSDFFIYYRAESGNPRPVWNTNLLTLQDITPDIKTHALNIIISELWGERFDLEGTFRFFRYDFDIQDYLTLYEYDVSDISSVRKAVVEIFQAIPVNDTYYYQIENLDGEKSLPKEIIIDFSPTSSEGFSE
jgi:hypothetical protein